MYIFPQYEKETEMEIVRGLGNSSFAFLSTVKIDDHEGRSMGTGKSTVTISFTERRGE